MQIASVKAAAREQEIDKLSEFLAEIVPDLTEQYTTFNIDKEVLRVRVRAIHAFQLRLAIRAVDLIADRRSLFVVDVGDSSGTHLIYLKSMLSSDPRFRSSRLKFLSVNMDPVAIEKIRSKGFDALLCRAEDLYGKHQIKADLLLSFEMLEHLNDPISFLSGISSRSVCKYFVLTVPYLAQSRVGLHHIRQQQKRDVFPENTHIFELSPMDWKLIFQHSGWKIIDEMKYQQYPQRSVFRVTKSFWKRFDFEGFYGFILERDRTWADLYKTGSSAIQLLGASPVNAC
ncbi:MAG: methyltransferase domain-containing protein [Deltaproteobacteria bacterium]|nr:methyltransferase domain-containing protein [Deltaproteobacteria bacterium]MBW2033864.1 methyltransferase domain-containing protein [Deltaproteobacteria bacterium]